MGALIAALITCLAVVPPAGHAAANVVTNPSLDEGDRWPTCFATSGWGSPATWALVDGRNGGRAVSLTITGYTNGDHKLLQSENADCAPEVEAGSRYDLGIFYTATAPVNLTVFRQTDAGWSYWGDLGTFDPSGTWTEAKATTPVIPEGTERIVFGLSLARNGTVITDDYSAAPLAATEPGEDPDPVDATNYVINPHLAHGDNPPACYTVNGWGDRAVTTRLSDDVPADSPAGTRALELTVADHRSGDAKLLLSEAANCAPQVEAGNRYDVSVDYTSTAPVSMTAFTHTAGKGWAYWMEVVDLPATATWQTARASLPQLSEGVDRVSFGLSIAGNGTIATTNYSLSDYELEVDDPIGEDGTHGRWEVLTNEMPVRAIHTTLLHDGRVLLIAGSGNSAEMFTAGTFTATLWDPTTDSYTDLDVPFDMFCSGHLTLPDGKVLISGGTVDYPGGNDGPVTFDGSDSSYYFDPADDQFHPTTDMADAHWYPTLTKLGNGDVWAAGGLDENAQGTVATEMFDYSEMSWLGLNEVPQTWSYWGTYPHMYLLDDGMMFYSGAHTFGNGLPGTGASLYDWESAEIWDVPGLRQKDLRDQAGSVLLPPAQDQKVMIAGGGNTDTNLPATTAVDIIDLDAAEPAYVPGPDLPGTGRAYVNLINLPDRTVLATNGAVYNRSGDVKEAALYDPEANTWLKIDPDPIGRNYHSTSLLLPDGRVAVFGSNPGNNTFETRISIYSPPYLFRGDRPTIDSAPETAGYGEVLGLEVSGDVTSASLISPMSSTHQTDTNARLVDLPIVGDGDQRTAQVPDNPNLLPPGPYMLNVVDSDGVPSVSEWIWIS